MKQNKYTFLLIIFFIVLMGFSYNSVKAENENNVIITWEVNNFYPADYPGKPKATPNSLLSISAVVIQNNKIVDPNDVKFFWYNNNEFMYRGFGKNEITFKVRESIGEKYFIRLRMEINDEVIEEAINIPVFGYEIAVDFHSFSNSINLGDHIELKSIPYFFNVEHFRNLKFFWNITNAEEQSKSGNLLNLNIGTQKSLLNTRTLITAWASNKNNPLESAKSILILNIK